MTGAAARRRVLAAILWCIAVISASGHGELDERIARATEQISRQPSDPDLYVRRASLRRLHEEYDLALEDLARAEDLSPGFAPAKLVRAETLLDAGRFEQALEAIDAFIAKQAVPHTLGRSLRARCLVKLGRVEPAVGEFTRAIEAAASPAPDLYMERARCQAALGSLEEALKGLEQGVERLGPVMALELQIVEYLKQSGDLDAAITRATAITARSPSKLSGWLLEGSLLEAAGRFGEARDRYACVLAPDPAVRATAATAQYREKAHASLERIKSRSLSANTTAGDHPSP